MFYGGGFPYTVCIFYTAQLTATLVGATVAQNKNNFLTFPDLDRKLVQIRVIRTII